MASPKLAEMVAYMRREQERGAPPTVRDIADHVGVSVSTAHRYLVAGEGLGYLVRRPRRGKVEWWVVDDD